MPTDWPEYAMDALAGLIIYALVLPLLRGRMTRITRMTVIAWLGAILLGIASCR